jgi:hypothetical protein
MKVSNGAIDNRLNNLSTSYENKRENSLRSHGRMLIERMKIDQSERVKFTAPSSSDT